MILTFIGHPLECALVQRNRVSHPGLPTLLQLEDTGIICKESCTVSLASEAIFCDLASACTYIIHYPKRYV